MGRIQVERGNKHGLDMRMRFVFGLAVQPVLATRHDQSLTQDLSDYQLKNRVSVSPDGEGFC